MMSERMTYEELQQKVQWEGGLDEVLSYGIKDTDVPLDLAYSWQALSVKFRSYQLQEDYVHMIIEREAARERTG